jgi:hypothetical protein
MTQIDCSDFTSCIVVDGDDTPTLTTTRVAVQVALTTGSTPN